MPVRASRPLLVAAALVALVAVVAAASRSGRAWGPSGRGDAGLSQGVVDYGYTIGIILAVAIGGAYLLLRLGVAGIASDRGRFSALQVILLWTFFIGLALLAYRAYQQVVLEGAPGDGAFLAPRSRPEMSDGSGPGNARDPQFQWWLAFVVGGAAVAGGAFLLARRRRPAPQRERRRAAETLADVLDDTLDDLRRERDARRAVIAAYARMERTLAAHGLPRRPPEAPLEFLSRILRELEVRPASAHALTELFERAKFSPHEIDLAMKEEAIDALGSVRDDLRAAA